MKIRIAIILLTLLFLGKVVEAGDGLSPPPVDVQFSAQKAEGTPEGLTLKLTVTPLADMHVDISCLVPRGVELLTEEGLSLRPYEDEAGADPARESVYREAVVLWVGPLSAGETKEFLLSVRVLDEGKREIIARIQALAQWGLREEILTIGVS
jgi:hypothetical protein